MNLNIQAILFGLNVETRTLSTQKLCPNIQSIYQLYQFNDGGLPPLSWSRGSKV